MENIIPTCSIHSHATFQFLGLFFSFVLILVYFAQSESSNLSLHLIICVVPKSLVQLGHKRLGYNDGHVLLGRICYQYPQTFILCTIPASFPISPQGMQHIFSALGNKNITVAIRQTSLLKNQQTQQKIIFMF